MEVKPRIRKFLNWYECDGNETLMSGETIEQSYLNWLKAWENTQRLKEVHKKACQENKAKNI